MSNNIKNTQANFQYHMELARVCKRYDVVDVVGRPMVRYHLKAARTLLNYLKRLGAY